MTAPTQNSINSYDDGQVIEFDATFTCLMQAAVNSGGTDQPAAGTSETLTVTTTTPWPVLLGGQSLLIMDYAEFGSSTGFEVMQLTANANGSDVNWTVLRGEGGTFPTAHAAGWTAIPVQLVNNRPAQLALPVDPTTVAWSYEFIPSGSSVAGAETTLTYTGSSSPQIGSLWRSALGVYRTWIDSTGAGPSLLAGKFVSTGTGKATKPRWAKINAPPF